MMSYLANVGLTSHVFYEDALRNALIIWCIALLYMYLWIQYWHLQVIQHLNETQPSGFAVFADYSVTHLKPSMQAYSRQLWCLPQPMRGNRQDVHPSLRIVVKICNKRLEVAQGIRITDCEVLILI